MIIILDALNDIRYLGHDNMVNQEYNKYITKYTIFDTQTWMVYNNVYLYQPVRNYDAIVDKYATELYEMYHHKYSFEDCKECWDRLPLESMYELTKFGKNLLILSQSRQVVDHRGDFIDGLPLIGYGEKGYCSVLSTQNMYVSFSDNDYGSFYIFDFNKGLCASFGLKDIAKYGGISKRQYRFWKDYCNQSREFAILYDKSVIAVNWSSSKWSITMPFTELRWWRIGIQKSNTY